MAEFYLRERGENMHKLIILCGKSSSGKDTVMRKLVSKGFKPAISYTTRPMRPKEKNHVDYHFVKRETFLKLLNNDGLVEYREYDTVAGKWYYGLGKSEIDLFDHDYVTIKDLKGVRELTDYFGKENCIVFYISASKYVRTQRAMSRGGFNQEEWDRRLKADNYDFRDSEVNKYCDIKLENMGDVNITVKRILNYVKLWNVEGEEK